MSEGATILLTWIINLIKWNAGHTRYKFAYPGESADGGSPERIMNNALVAENQQLSDGKNDENRYRQDDQKKNKYALKMNEQQQPK